MIERLPENNKLVPQTVNTRRPPHMQRQEGLGTLVLIQVAGVPLLPTLGQNTRISGHITELVQDGRNYLPRHNDLLFNIKASLKSLPAIFMKLHPS
jgi:hypothetical protein